MRLRTRWTLGAVVGVVGGAALLSGCGHEDDDTEASPPASTAPAVVADDTWCTGWKSLITVQGQWVADPTAANAALVIDVVGDLQALGVPESLDPAGYTELTAVLDDVRASVDPSFTPSVRPSEPADVAVEPDPGDGHGDEHMDETDDDHEGHGADASDAPFGAWLAEYCAG